MLNGRIRCFWVSGQCIFFRSDGLDMGNSGLAVGADHDAVRAGEIWAGLLVRRLREWAALDQINA